MESFSELMGRVRTCDTCASALGHPPRPVLRVGPCARIALIGQAPGAKVHESGVPWQDRSGEHLLEWLGVSRAVFEDPDAFAILPMGFCYPGKGHGADLPPRPECAPLWHDAILSRLPEVRLTLLVGQYAQATYLGERRKGTLTETVRSFREYLPEQLPLPHPSWRSRRWRRQNPWFDETVIPVLRQMVHISLGSADLRRAHRSF